MVAYAITAFGVSGVSLLAPLLPDLAELYGVSASDLSWYQTAVMLPGVVTAVATTHLVERIGLRPSLTGGLLLFGVAGTALAFVPDLWPALVLRVLQGIGSGGLVAMAVILLRRLPDGVSARAVGANSAVVSLAMVALPLVGSALGALSVRAPFLVYAAAAAVLGAVVSAVLPRGEPRPRRDGPPGPSARMSWVMASTVVLNVAFFGWLLYLTPIVLDARGVGLGLRGAVLSAQSGIATIVTLATVRLRESVPVPRLLAASWGGARGDPVRDRTGRRCPLRAHRADLGGGVLRGREPGADDRGVGFRSVDGRRLVAELGSSRSGPWPDRGQGTPRDHARGVGARGGCRRGGRRRARQRDETSVGVATASPARGVQGSASPYLFISRSTFKKWFNHNSLHRL